MLVWLTDWQLAEDRLLISVGDSVDWTVFPSDREWIARLFEDRLVIEWQYDSYGDAVPGPSRNVVGTVTGLQSVRCRQQRSAAGIEPVRGAARLRSVTDTSGSWRRTVPLASELPATVSSQKMYTFSYGSSEPEEDALYGYAATVTPRE